MKKRSRKAKKNRVKKGKANNKNLKRMSMRLLRKKWNSLQSLMTIKRDSIKLLNKKIPDPKIKSATQSRKMEIFMMNKVDL